MTAQRSTREILKEQMPWAIGTGTIVGLLTGHVANGLAVFAVALFVGWLDG